MNRIALLILLALPLSVVGQNPEQLYRPETARIVGLGGAFVALADDPAAGFLNPCGLRSLTQVCYDLFYGSTTTARLDQIGIALSNPGMEHGTAFAMGAWAQGWTTHRKIVYLVPYSGSSFDLTSSTHFGLVLRAPYLLSRIPGISSHWETVADLSALQSFESLRLGIAIERAIGGGAEFIPRRLHVGGAFHAASTGFALAYEWQGDQTSKDYSFMRSSSHYGVEIPLGQYATIRSGYIAGASHRVAFGMAVGNMKTGWRIEGGWELPAAVRGSTRWVVGMGYRI